MNSLAAAHARCAEILSRSGSSFALPIRLLPVPKRAGTTAIYAFCRVADDLVDEATTVPAARAGLDAFENCFRAAIAGEEVDDPVIRALHDTVQRFAVPADLLLDILTGVRMDLERRQYRTVTDLEIYCRRVASAVGLAAMHVWGFQDGPETRSAADACGLAFQWTNILRDIPEDLGRGRIYLPEEDFLAAGCRSEDLRAGRIGPEFSRLAALEADRAEGWFNAARPLDGALSPDGRRVFRAMFGVYRELLGAVHRQGIAIFSRRVRPAKWRLLAAGGWSVVRGLGAFPA